MAVKPPAGSTVDAAHALAPLHCWIMDEGAGRPHDIGTAMLPPPSGDTPTWSAAGGGFGDQTEWDGTQHCEYGTGAFLAGLTKFTIVLSADPDDALGWNQTGGWITKKISSTSGFVFFFGPSSVGFTSSVWFELGDATATDYGIDYGWFVPTPTGGQQQIICAYDASRSAGDRVRLWIDGTQITTGQNSGDPVSVEGTPTVPSDTTTPIKLGEGAKWSETQAGKEFKGALGYLYIIPDFFPDSGDITALVADPFPFVIDSPLVTEIAVGAVTDAAATITWTTDVNATSRVEYGIGNVSSFVEDSSPVTAHSIPLSGLTPESAYWFRVKSTAASVTATSGIHAFQTEQTPAVLGPLLIDRLSATKVRVSFTTDIPTTAVLDYGLTASYGSQVTDATLRTLHHMDVSGLSASTAYHLRATVSTAGSVETQGNDAVLTTAAADSTAPAAIDDLAAIRSAQNGIRLRWTAPGNDGGTGRAASYTVKRSTSAINSGNFDAATTVAQAIEPTMAGGLEELIVSGLDADTTYHFAVKATDPEGNVGAISNVPSVDTLAGRQEPDVWGGDPRIQSPTGINVGCTFTGTSTGLTTTTLTDSGASFPTDGRLVGKLLCPDTTYKTPGAAGGRRRWWVIVSNTATTITVNTSLGDGTMTAIITSGKPYMVTGVFAVEKIGDQWWFIDPEGNAFMARATALCLDKYTGGFQTAHPYEAIYLETAGGTVTANLRDAGATWAFDPTDAPGDVVNAGGVTCHAVDDKVYLGSTRPFAETYFQMEQVGAGGAMQWYYSTASGWALVRGDGIPQYIYKYTSLSTLNTTAWALDQTDNGSGGDPPEDNGLRVAWFTEFTGPSDWAPRVVASTDGVARYYIRGVVTTQFTTDPKVSACFENAHGTRLLAMKYRDATVSIGQDTMDKWRSWGFNASGYASSFADYANDADIIRHMPVWAGTLCTFYADPPVKNIYENVPNAGSPDIDVRLTGDMWEPSLVASVAAIVAGDDAFYHFRPNPNILLTITDEPDFVYGMSWAKERTHMAYCIAATNPHRPLDWQGNATADATKRMFAKYAMRDFLRYRYKPTGESLTPPSRSMTAPLYSYSATPGGDELTALTNLNAAWDTDYTTWETSSGDVTAGTNDWGDGTGWLDEDGRHLVTTYPPLANAGAGSHVSYDNLAANVRTPAIYTDIRDFSALCADRYAYVVYDQVKARTPNLLASFLYGPSPEQAAVLNGQAHLQWDSASPLLVRGDDALTHQPYRTVEQYEAYQTPLYYEVYTYCTADSSLNYGGVVTAVSYNGGTDQTAVTWALGQHFMIRNHVARRVRFVESAVTRTIVNFVGLTMYIAGDQTGVVAVDDHVQFPDTIANAWSYTPWPDTRPAAAAAEIDEINEPIMEARAADGTYPVLGLERWAEADNPEWLSFETEAWGFRTTNYNAYDGVEAVVATSQDANGVWRGGEYKAYGDYLTTMGAYMRGLEDSVVLRTTAPVTPTFLSTAVASWDEDALSFFHVATAGAPQARITLDSGALPAGVALLDNQDGTAVLGGVPTASGSYPIVLRATNSAGTTTQEFSLTVEGDAPAAPAYPGGAFHQAIYLVRY